MNGVFLWTMRHAAYVLFVLAAAIVLGSLIADIIVYRHQQDDPSGVWLAGMVLALLKSLQDAALPFIGAAAIWRYDHRQRRLPAEAAE